ncbi:MAG: hypothetical protein JKY37_17730 [Nannocystaceae bacterium]|nr:hypothetical protein [Nannocystaceae bacterium]
MHRFVLAVGAVLFIGVRLHVVDDDIPNPDIAGILYNAELLLDGGLPYIDTVEAKPAGSFFMVALAFAMFGRGLLALQLVHVLWLLAAAPAVWLVASELSREHSQRVRSVTAALATAVYLTYAPMFSYNYSSWMMPAYAWAGAAVLVGLRRDKLSWHVLAGASAMVAYATMQRAVVLAALMLAFWGWARRLGLAGARPLAFVGWGTGAALAFTALAMPYLLIGEAGAFLNGLFPFDTALRYTAQSDVGFTTVALGAATQLVQTFWFAALLVGLGVVASILAARSGEQPPRTDVWFVGTAWLVASIAGAAIGGGRFYVHYLVQYVPALAVMAAHPSVVALLLGDGSNRRAHIATRVGVGLAVAAQLYEVGVGSGHRYGSMARRLGDGRTAAQAAGAHIVERTQPGDRIAAWGWTAWRVYYWADRRAPGAIYKPMGTLTTFNTNTAFTPGGNIEFTPGPRSEEYIAAFDANPPAFFVYSPSFVLAFGARPDPLQAFGPLRQRLERDYVIDGVYGDLRLFRRRPGA